jgi:hypothetical protein
MAIMVSGEAFRIAWAVATRRVLILSEISLIVTNPVSRAEKTAKQGI